MGQVRPRQAGFERLYVLSSERDVASRCLCGGIRRDPFNELVGGNLSVSGRGGLSPDPPQQGQVLQARREKHIQHPLFDDPAALASAAAEVSSCIAKRFIVCDFSLQPIWNLAET